MSTPLEVELAAHIAERFPQSVPGGSVYGSVDAVMVGSDLHGLALKVVQKTPLDDLELQRLMHMISGLASSMWAFPLRARPYYARLLLLATLIFDSSVPDDFEA